jgi:glycosyltransferase involved in cell wall biosynthesis
MKESSRVIANSKYVSERLKNDFDVESDVVYPPINIQQYQVKYNQDGFIGMVSPRNEQKGADIFLDIVDSTPSEEFITAGTFRKEKFKKRASSMENLTHLGYIEDMREFYKLTKLLVVPPRRSVTFGRVVAEAMSNGIPCVASDIGAHPEILGNTGKLVSDIEHTNAWIDAIHMALKNRNPNRSIKRARKFSAEKQGTKLNNIISNILPESSL